MIEVVVTSRRTEAQDICSYELASVDGSPLPAFSAGAHIDVHLPDGLIRQYSLCNHPQERHRYVIGVLNDPASRGGSRSLHAHVHAGTRLSISAPRNLFPLAHEARRSLLFAGGIGITPILCMAERLAHTGADFELHYCARARERAAFVQRLKASPFAERVFLHFDEQPDTALHAAEVLARRQTTCTCTSAAPAGSCSTYLRVPGPRVGKKPACTVNTFRRHRWTAASTAGFRCRSAAAAKSSRSRPTRAWCRSWKVTASRLPCPANRGFAAPA